MRRPFLSTMVSAERLAAAATSSAAAHSPRGVRGRGRILRMYSPAPARFRATLLLDVLSDYTARHEVFPPAFRDRSGGYVCRGARTAPRRAAGRPQPGAA